MLERLKITIPDSPSFLNNTSPSSSNMVFPFSRSLTLHFTFLFSKSLGKLETLMGAKEGVKGVILTSNEDIILL